MEQSVENTPTIGDVVKLKSHDADKGRRDRRRWEVIEVFYPPRYALIFKRRESPIDLTDMYDDVHEEPISEYRKVSLILQRIDKKPHRRTTQFQIKDVELVASEGKDI